MSTEERGSEWTPKPISDAETLYDVAHARAGDKRDISNITVIPYDDAIYDDLVEIVTPERVKDHFSGLVTGDVERYRVPNVSSMNFVLHGALTADGRNRIGLTGAGRR